MMRCGGGCELRWTEIEAWIRDYDNIQWLAVKLIYAQIGCSLIGSLGALYNGVLLVNLGISLFALVAIESSSQSLARTYAVLLFCSILLDISWFFLFSHDIWRIPSEIYGTFVSISVKLTFAMQIMGFSVRLSSSLLWMQMYRLGVSYIDNSVPRDTEADLRNSFLSPATPIIRRPSGSDDVVGGSIYDPAYYSSLFEDGRDDTCSYGHLRVAFLFESSYFLNALRKYLIKYLKVDVTPEGGQNHNISVVNSVSAAETPHLSPPMGRPFHVKDDENAAIKFQMV
ncbi:hypothetical protein BUALT_Bualt02G0017700 [Buddleja alternifolia]|uniref:Transmembrane protein n=1 Tax=Buddleja alternifolia TaxID=168488 RepID=A0AAV6XWR7_9LAMI|nr:hypothetical protein BUALT_Bualt02G0017700 [Buddleja alternifolia]